MDGNVLPPQTARERLYEIMREESEFDQKARQALNLGVQYLDADNGHLTRIDPQTDHWKVTVSTDPQDGEFPAGLELDLNTTYCRRTIAGESPIALHDAPNQGWDDDPAFETHGLNCYHGTELYIDDEPYGTTCFVANDSRDRPFSDAETMFAELIARLLERELERTQYEAELSSQANLINVLNRVLRHNLRNNLTVVRGRTQLLAGKLSEDTHTDSVLRQLDQLLDLCEKARDLEQIVSKDYDRQSTHVVRLVENLVESVAAEYPSASFIIDGNEDITAAVRPSFERALEELIENAAKHGGPEPTVTVAVEYAPNTIEIQVTDDGPGISDQERRVLETGAETPLVHGSGLGLWLAYWIITSHEGSIEATVTDDGTVMTVSIPRTPDAGAEQHMRRLRQARDEYQAAFEEAFDGMVLFDDEARIIDANPAASDIFGLDRQALLGRAIPEFLRDGFDFEAVWDQFKNAGDLRETVTIVGKDGTDRLVEYSATTDVVPGHHLVTYRDITERQERDQELEETTQRLEAVVEASPDPIIALDTDGVIRLWNEAAEELFGYTADDVLNEPIHSLNLHSGEQEAPFKERFKRATAGERFTNLRVQRKTNDGERVYLSISTAPYRSAAGDIAGVMAVMKDISDRVGQ